MNRVLETCGTILKGLLFMSMESQREKEKKIGAEKVGGNNDLANMVKA